MDKKLVTLGYVRRMTDDYELTTEEAQKLLGDSYLVVGPDVES